MLNAFQLRKIWQIKNPLTVSHCFLQLRFLRHKTSINTAIHRGLRNSKDVGFRGKQRSPREKGDDLQEKRTEWGRQPMSRKEPWRRGPEYRNSKDIGSIRIRRGDKIIKTDAQLARKKPNPAGPSPPRGSFRRNQSPMELLENEARASLIRGHYTDSGPPPFRRFGLDSASPSSISSSFGDRVVQPRAKEKGSRYKPARAIEYGKQNSKISHRSEDDLERGGNKKSHIHQFGSEKHSFRSPGRLGIGRNIENSDNKSIEPTNKNTHRAPKSDTRFPISLTHTTAASEFLYGTSVVEAALSSEKLPRRQLYKLYIYGGENRQKYKQSKDVDIEKLARKSRVKVVKVQSDGLSLMDKMSGGRPHNGYVLEASPLPRLPITSLGEISSRETGYVGFNVNVDHQSREEAAINGQATYITTGRAQKRKPLILLLDSIVDPQNLGGILRTASFLGVSAVAVSARNSAPFTPVVLKASAGASENITLLSVNKPAQFIQDSKHAGWKVFAAVAPASKTNNPKSPVALSVDNLLDPLTEDPCILMLGGEGEGLRRELQTKADVELYIPSIGRSQTIDSLNVNVAAGILCTAFLRNNQLKEKQIEQSHGLEEPTKSPHAFPDVLF